MKGGRPPVHPLSLLLSTVYRKAREGCSFGPADGLIEVI